PLSGGFRAPPTTGRSPERYRLPLGSVRTNRAGAGGSRAAQGGEVYSGALELPVMKPKQGAVEMEEIASEWITRRAGGLSAEEEQALAVWLAADPRHAETYRRLASTWAVFDRAEQQGVATAVVTKLQVRARSRRRRRLQATAVAGMLA